MGSGTYSQYSSGEQAGVLYTIDTFTSTSTNCLLVLPSSVSKVDVLVIGGGASDCRCIRHIPVEGSSSYGERIFDSLLADGSIYKQGKDKGEKPQPKPSGASKQRIDNLLDAVNNEEKKVQEKVNAQKVQANPKKPEKDW